MLVNLDVKLIDDSKELSRHIKKLKDSKTNILYSNIISNIVIGNKQLHAQYDKALYSKELLILTREDIATDIREELIQNRIDYNEVIFSSEDKTKLNNKENKKIVFARGKETLLEALRDSRDKGIETATIYPNMTGWMDFKYNGFDGTKIKLDNICLKVGIELEDKYIFLVHEHEKRNINFVKAIKHLDNEGFFVTINPEKELPVSKRKQYKK